MIGFSVFVSNRNAYKVWARYVYVVFGFGLVLWSDACVV